MTSKHGYIYVLINPSMPNLVKIGMTTRSVDDRIRELSLPTGIATPFINVFTEKVTDPSYAESLIHSELQSTGVRLRNNREFFQVPVNTVVKLINRVLQENPNLTNFEPNPLESKSKKRTDSPVEKALKDIENSLIEANNQYLSARDNYRDTLYYLAILPKDEESTSLFGLNVGGENFHAAVGKARNKLSMFIEDGNAFAAYILTPILFYDRDCEGLNRAISLIQTSVSDTGHDQFLIQVIGEYLLAPSKFCAEIDVNSWIEKYADALLPWLMERAKHRSNDLLKREGETLEKIFDCMIAGNVFDHGFSSDLDELLPYIDLLMAYKITKVVIAKGSKSYLAEEKSSDQKTAISCAEFVVGLFDIRNAVVEYHNISSSRSSYFSSAWPEQDTSNDEVESGIKAAEDALSYVVQGFLNTYKRDWILYGIDAFDGHQNNAMSNV